MPPIVRILHVDALNQRFAPEIAEGIHSLEIMST